MNKLSRYLLPTLFTLLLSLPVLANELEFLLPGPDVGKQAYAGLQFSANKVALLTGSRVQGNVTTRMSADNSDAAYGLVAGANYNRYMSMEARYQNLGSYTHKLDYADASQSVQASVNSELEYQALSLLLRPHYLLGHGFSVEAEAGLVYARFQRDSEVSVSGKKSQAQMDDLEQDLQNRLGTGSDKEFGFTYGVGMAYQRSASAWQWRYSIQWLDLEEEVSVMGFSVLRSF